MGSLPSQYWSATPLLSVPHSVLWLSCFQTPCGPSFGGGATGAALKVTFCKAGSRVPKRPWSHGHCLTVTWPGNGGPSQTLAFPLRVLGPCPGSPMRREGWGRYLFLGACAPWWSRRHLHPRGSPTVPGRWELPDLESLRHLLCEMGGRAPVVGAMRLSPEHMACWLRG